MTSLSLIDADPKAVAFTAVTSDGLEAWRADQPDQIRRWIDTTGFKGESGATCLIADSDGGLSRVVLGLGAADPWAGGRMSRELPSGSYWLDEVAGVEQQDEAQVATSLCLAWALGAYRFDRYKSDTSSDPATLVWPEDADRTYVEGAANAAWLTRDLINTPAEDMGPDALAAAAGALANTHGADLRVTVGEDLLAENFPAIYAVGRAATNAPRLIDLTWGQSRHPKVTLVGKGVCFDSGGLNIKPTSGMRLMKKDMGGAATVLGLADWIMRAQLPVRLRVLVPAVENAISGNAFRPGDVVSTRKGKSIEVGNTDAEGRVVLSDALTLACEEDPALIVDCATLTGAARVALGPELPAMFTPDDDLADALIAASQATADPMWRLPLWAGYRRLIDSKVADINNAGESGFAGAITAALFLESFVSDAVPWVHFDLFGWNPDDKPGRPSGGEAYAQRALFATIRDRFA